MQGRAGVLSDTDVHRGGAPPGGHEVFCSVLAPWVVVSCFLLGVSSCLVAVTCVLPGAVPPRCIYSGRPCGASGFVVSAGARGVACTRSCGHGFASYRVLCVLFWYCVLLLTVCFICSLLFAAGCLRSPLRPDASSASCPVLHRGT